MNTCNNNNFHTFSAVGVEGKIYYKGGVSNAQVDECAVPAVSASGTTPQVVT